MELIIQNNIRLGELQQQFNALFPYLRLEFFYPSSNPELLFSKENMVKDKNITLGEIRAIDEPGFIRVLRYHTVNKLERTFNDEYGLYTQVFRKSGDQWLETTSTDNWTLAKQNKTGKEKQTELFVDRPEEEDYHEQL